MWRDLALAEDVWPLEVRMGISDALVFGLAILYEYISCCLIRSLCPCDLSDELRPFLAKRGVRTRAEYCARSTKHAGFFREGHWRDCPGTAHSKMLEELSLLK